MQYELKITRREKNPDYYKELEEQDKWRKSPYAHGQEPIAVLWLERDALITAISEEQFEAIRKAVLEKF